MRIRREASWRVPRREITPEGAFQNRRDLLRKVGISSAAGFALLRLGASPTNGTTPGEPIRSADLYPARRTARWTIDRPLTAESVASRNNIFDEFSLDRSHVWKVAEGFASRPWRIHVGGAVEKHLQFDVDELIRKMGIEERVYRFRCVETWAMAVPWTGFPFQRFIDLVKPLSAARYVRMVTAARPEQMPGWYSSKRVFPYYEALSLAEASNELAFLATGIYYSFESNVDPKAPGQAEETILGTDQTRPTLPYNGYGELVAHLYG